MRARNSRTSSSVEGVVERQHRHGVCATLAKAVGRRRADPLARAVRAHQLGEARLDGLVAPAQRVVVGVADLRRVLLVVEPSWCGDLLGQPLELGLGLRPRSAPSTGVWRAGLAHRPLPARSRLVGGGARLVGDLARRPACARSPRAVGGVERGRRSVRRVARSSRSSTAEWWCAARPPPAANGSRPAPGRSFGQPGEPLADRVRRRAADAGVDLVEDQGRRRHRPRPARP